MIWSLAREKSTGRETCWWVQRADIAVGIWSLSVLDTSWEVGFDSEGGQVRKMGPEEQTVIRDFFTHWFFPLLFQSLCDSLHLVSSHLAKPFLRIQDTSLEGRWSWVHQALPGLVSVPRKTKANQIGRTREEPDMVTRAYKPNTWEKEGGRCLMRPESLYSVSSLLVYIML